MDRQLAMLTKSRPPKLLNPREPVLPEEYKLQCRVRTIPSYVQWKTQSYGFELGIIASTLLLECRLSHVGDGRKLNKLPDATNSSGDTELRQSSHLNLIKQPGGLRLVVRSLLLCRIETPDATASPSNVVELVEVHLNCPARGSNKQIRVRVELHDCTNVPCAGPNATG